MDQATDKQNLQNAEILNFLIEALKEHGRSGPVTEALARLAQRMARSVESLTLLFSKHNPGDANFDAATIMRGVYDAHLQTLYILKDPETHTEQYRNYQWVEQHKINAALTSLAARNSPFAKHILSTVKSDQVTVTEYERIKAIYVGCRNQWYPGTLVDLAKAVGYENEWLILSKMLNGIVHSSYLALSNGHPLSGAALVEFCWVLIFRVMANIFEYEGLEVEQDIVERIFRPSREDLFRADISEVLREEIT